jgi:hypothetical protein
MLRTGMLILVEQGPLDPATRAALRAVLDPLTTLQDVVRWGFSQTPPVDVAAVVVQDEYSHDVVLPWGLQFLVFDTT